MGFDYELVVDWEDRIKDYTPEIKQFYYTAFDKLKFVEDMLINNTLDWAVQKDSKKKGQEIYCDMATSPTTNGPILRCWTYTDHEPMESIRAYFNEEVHKTYDKNVAECHFDGIIGCNLLSGYQCGFRVLTVAARDCAQIGMIQPARDGSFKAVIWGNDAKPARDGYVRMTMPYCGIIFKPLKDDPRGKTQVIMCLEATLGGSLPGWVQKQAIAQTYNGQLTFRKLIAKYLAKHPLAQTKQMIEQ